MAPALAICVTLLSWVNPANNGFAGVFRYVNKRSTGLLQQKGAVFEYWQLLTS